MKIIKMECPNCGASIEVAKEGQTVCSHCNASFYAEEKEKNIVVNTTIYRYGHEKRAYGKHPAAAFLGTILRALLGIAFFLIITSAILITFFRSRNRDILSTFGPKEVRTAVESNLMIEFCEMMFAKSLADIGSADYERLSYLKISENRQTAGGYYWELEYRMEGGGEGSLRVMEKEISEASIEIEDFQCFTNLEELDLSGVSVVRRNYDGSSYDLRNLEKLRAFSGGLYTAAEDVQNLFAAPESVKKISVSTYHPGKGLEKLVKNFPNLEELNIDYTSVESLKELSGLSKLKALEIDSIKDNSYLSSLSALESLTLKGNEEHADYSVLFGMPGLKKLNLENARGIKNIDFIANMPNLESFSIDHSQIRDIEGLRDHQNLRSLSLVENQEIRDYSPIESLSSLEELQANLRWVEQGTVFPMLAALPSLKKLDITDRWIERIGASQSIEELSIMLPLTSDADLAVLAGISNLSALRLYGDGNPVHIKALAGCPKLKRLSIEEVRIHYHNDLEDLFNIPSLERLELLNLDGFNVGSGAVADNETLKYLYIDKGDYVCTAKQSDLKLGDVSDIFSKLHALEELTIKESGIFDLSFAQSMPRLRYLDISDNYVSDVSVLADNRELAVLVCRDNSIANADVLGEEVLIIR